MTSGGQVSSEDCLVDSNQGSAVEAELIRQLLLGDGQAWAKFIDQFGGIVRSRVSQVAALFGRRNDESLIDDATSEVFAALLANEAAALRCFRGQSRLSTYLSVIATRVARRTIAQSMRRTRGQTESLDDAPDLSDHQDVESGLMSGEETQRLLQLVQRLPPRQRELVVAYYKEEQTYAEMSRRFDIPIGSIGNSLRRAEKQLRQWVDDEN